LALARVEPAGRSRAIELLENLLATDGDTRVRHAAESALRGLGQLQSSTARREELLGCASPDLQSCIAKLDDPDAAAREEAADVLGEMGPSAAAARGALLRATSDPDRRVRARASWALGRLGKRDGA
jgi:HEAT repeat protein